MKRTLKSTILTLAIAGMAFAANPEDRIQKKVRTELLALPFLSVFDNLGYRLDGETLYLSGHVIRPTLKSDAANRVARLEGVRNIVNKIEVLPLSPYDDRLRLAVARAVYGANGLNRYALGANPSIRILVKNGGVTLEGVVANEIDRNVANLMANGVSGVFSVTNNLRVERGRV
ncbi:MAG: BON domain-containing protein [Acidobacteria bacterium]|nr:BON domain-containing protein [Acidobacteriota bacterium]